MPEMNAAPSGTISRKGLHDDQKDMLRSGNKLAADISDGAVGGVHHLEPAVHFSHHGQGLASVASGKHLRLRGGGAAEVHPTGGAAGTRYDVISCCCNYHKHRRFCPR